MPDAPRSLVGMRSYDRCISQAGDRCKSATCITDESLVEAPNLISLRAMWHFEADAPHFALRETDGADALEQVVHMCRAATQSIAMLRVDAHMVTMNDLPPCQSMLDEEIMEPIDVNPKP